MGSVLSPLLAQDDNIVLTVALPGFIESNLDDELFTAFEEANGVSVVTVPNDDAFFGQPGFLNEEDPGEYFDNAETYAAQGDVLYVNTFNMSPELTTAGYFLDLSPLTSSDPDLNIEDFVPSLWDHFQWDGGVWALPVGGNLNVLVYDRNAFDAAGITYPDLFWTLSDFDFAVRELTQFNDAGEVELPGFQRTDTRALYFALTNGAIAGNGAEPPDMTDPAIVEFIETWNVLTEEGYFGSFGPDQNFDPQDIPMAIDSQFRLSGFGPGSDDQDWQAALLPGGYASAQVTGYAVSGGTAYPQEAYELAKFMTSDPEIATRSFELVRARRSLADYESEDSDFFIPNFNISDDNQAVLDEAVDAILPIRDLRYTSFLDAAINRTLNEEEPLSIEDSLEQAQAEMQQLADLAVERGGTQVVAVATPVPTPVLSAEEIALDINVSAFGNTLPNEEGWEAFIADFTANDPQVGFVDVGTGFGQLADLSEDYDCFYSGFNFLEGGALNTDLSLLLPLDPFISADPIMDPAVMVPGTLEAMNAEGVTYGVPMSIQPNVLQYNIEKFEQAGLFPPQAGWALSEFEDALRVLGPDDENPPFVPRDFGGSTYALLIVAYGGVPMDYTTNPVTVNLTDPATVQAVRDVLDLARDGYMDYQRLVQSGGAFFGFGGGGGGEDPPALTSESLNIFAFGGPRVEEEPERIYEYTTYPVGGQFAPASYQLGGGFISASTENPEACYRFLSALTQRPDLFQAMPAYLPALDNPGIRESLGEEVTVFYEAYAQTLENPNTFLLSGFGGGGEETGSFIYSIWVNRAFDAYVLDDGVLEEELAQAEQNITDYRDCAAGLEQPDFSSLRSQREIVNAFRPFIECSIAVDPSLEDQFGFFLAQDEE